MPPFVPIQKNRSPGAGEKVCPTCDGSGNVDTHICKTCHHSGVVPSEWKAGDGPLTAAGKIDTGSANKGSTPAATSSPKGRAAK
jgi:hypothetical protein